MARQRLRPPNPVSIGAVARRDLEEQGVAAADAALIASAALEFFGLPPDGSLAEAEHADSVRWHIQELGKLIAKSDRDAGLAAWIDLLALNRLPPPRENPTPEQADAIRAMRGLATRCRELGVDFGGAFVRAIPLRQSTDPTGTTWFARRLLLLGALQPGQVMRQESALTLGDEPDWWDFQRSYANRTDHTSNPESLLFWLELVDAAAVEPLLMGVEALPDPEFIRLARGIAYALGVWPRSERHIHAEFFAERGPAFAAVTRRVFEEADRRVGERSPAPNDLRHVWLRFAWMAVDADGDWVSEETRKRLVRASADDIGRLRPLLRRASADDASELRRLDPHFRSCLFLLFKLGSLWEATKPLLLAFRAIGTRSIGLDLRYWGTSKPDDPPQPWEMVPRSLMNMLHHYFRGEQEGDATLDAYRAAFAGFCLERLKTRERKTAGPTVREEDLVDSDAAWREGFIQAARALCVNPGGKGHHILHWTSQNDPDPAVRELAASAYTELRHQPRLPKGLSPRRAVFDAFWWLRQAHLNSLDVEVDLDAASRTREEEARRTTEAERQ